MVGFFLLFGLTLWHFGRYRRLWVDARDGKRGGIEPEERLIPRKSEVTRRLSRRVPNYIT